VVTGAPPVDPLKHVNNLNLPNECAAAINKSTDPPSTSPSLSTDSTCFERLCARGFSLLTRGDSDKRQMRLAYKDMSFFSETRTKRPFNSFREDANDILHK
jgi:hypothetical protein